MNNFEKTYLDILLESPTWKFSDEFIKKDDYKNVGIYFNQDHIVQRLKDRYDNKISLTQLLNSCKNLLNH